MNNKINRKLESINLHGNDFWFYFIPLLISTIFLAGTAAYFSVFGLSKIFAGAKIPAIIMASAIEFGKIVAVSFTNKFWDSIGKLKGYLLTAIIVAMVVTSASIFGFLSDAYQKTANQLTVVQSKISIEENKKTNIINQIDAYNKQIEYKNNRINQLNTLRLNQENRLDSLYNKGWYTAAKRTEKLISDANTEIINLTSDISDLSDKITIMNNTKNEFDIKILELNSVDASSELGPIIFVKDLFNTEMDTVVVVFIIMLIFVFDPMAMSLVIAINKLLSMRYSTNNKKAEIIDDKPIMDIVAVESIDDRFEKINNETTNSGLVVKPQIIDNEDNRQ
jgi:hypothetical protein